MVKKMQSTKASYKPAPVLFVEPTGGGKSLVRDVHAVMVKGITLTIVPLLALGADQTAKINKNALQTSGYVL